MTKGKFPNGLKAAMDSLEKPIPDAELARRVGTHRQNLARWKFEEQKIPLEMARKLAAALKTTAAALLLVDKEPPKQEPSPALAELLQLAAQLPDDEIAAALEALSERRADEGLAKSQPDPRERKKAKTQ